MSLKQSKLEAFILSYKQSLTPITGHIQFTDLNNRVEVLKDVDGIKYSLISLMVVYVRFTEIYRTTVWCFLCIHIGMQIYF